MSKIDHEALKRALAEILMTKTGSLEEDRPLTAEEQLEYEAAFNNVKTTPTPTPFYEMAKKNLEAMKAAEGQSEKGSYAPNDMILKMSPDAVNAGSYMSTTTDTPLLTRKSEAGLTQDEVNHPDHYSRWPMEPIEFIAVNDLPWWLANVVKYCMRYDAKDGLSDMYKGRSYLEMKIRHLEGIPRFWDHPVATERALNVK